MKKIVIICVTFLVTLVVASDVMAQARASDAYDNARKCYSNVKSSAARAAQRSEWERCIDMFEKVNAAFPKQKRGIDAIYSAARLRRELYDRFRDPQDIEGAIKLYNRVVREYPENSLADDSLYQIAVLRHKPLGQDLRARKALTHLVAEFPGGDMTPKAKRLLASLGGPVESGEKTKTPDKEKIEEEKTIDEVEEISSGTSSPFDADVAGPFERALLTNIDIDEKAGATTVKLKFNRAVAYSLEFTEQGARTKSPPKLELVLSYAKPSKALAKELTVASPYLDRIKLRKRFLGSGSRLVFIMAPGSTYEVIPKDSQIELKFRNTDGSVPAEKLAPADVVQPKEDESKKKS